MFTPSIMRSIAELSTRIDEINSTEEGKHLNELSNESLIELVRLLKEKCALLALDIAYREEWLRDPEVDVLDIFNYHSMDY